MSDDTTATPTETADTGIDIEAASDKIGLDLFPETLPEEKETTPQETVTQAVTDATAPAPLTAEPPAVRPAPKSWAKDVHEVWGKIDPKAQEYIEKREKDFLNGLDQYKSSVEYAQSIQKVLQPYDQLLQSRGLDAPKAIDDMMRAYTSLTNGSVEQRQAALTQMAKHLQIPFPTMANGTDTTGATVDPRLLTLEQQIQQLNQVMTSQQQAALQAAQEKASAEVAAFASDPSHALFDECHEDIVKFIKAGDSLQEAYDKAVWANPVTREKQKLSWFQTETEKAKERARLDALPKQKARSVNVQSRDTQRTPTEPLGSMDETLRSTFRELKSKTAH
jgi:hypothetical protein